MPGNLYRKGRNTRSRATPSTSKTRRRSALWSHRRSKLRATVGALGCKNSLSSAFLNVDGLSEPKLENVRSYVSDESPDVFFLLETKRRLEEIGSNIDVSGYDVTEIRRSDASGDKAGGGIAFYTKNTGGLLFKRHSPSIEHRDLKYVNIERFWVTIDSLQCMTAICGVYIGCQYGDDRHAEWNEGIYWVLRQEVLALKTAGYRIEVLGDFNGHVGDTLGQGIVGNNPHINRNGERLLSFLRNCDLRHINGELRVPGDPSSRICSGLWTWQRGGSRSIIDYAVLSIEHIDTVISMNVDDRGFCGGGSDHNWTKIVLSDKFRRLMRVNLRPQKKKVWNIQEDQDWTAFQCKVNELLPKGDLTAFSVDDLASRLVSALHSAGQSAIGFKTRRHAFSMKSRSLPRFLVEALAQKRLLESKWKTLSSAEVFDSSAVIAAEGEFVKQSHLVDELFSRLRVSKRPASKQSLGSSGSAARKKFWADLSGKAKQPSSISAVLSPSGSLKCTDDKIIKEVEDHLCNVFQGSFEEVKDQEVENSGNNDHSYCNSGNPPSMSDHSYCLNTTPQLPKLNDSEDLESNPSNWLGTDFTLSEVRRIVSKLKNGKAFGWDNIPPEFLKHSPEPALIVMCFLFNRIKNSGIFPRGWICGRITLVHKKGPRTVLGNYRPITVLVSLSSLYSKLLNERLITVVEHFGLLGEIQNGFRKDRCGSDNVFILSSIL